MTNPRRYADVNKADRKITREKRGDLFKLAQQLEYVRQLIQHGGETWQMPDWDEVAAEMVKATEMLKGMR